MTKAAGIFVNCCIDGIIANEGKALENLMRSSALATVFVPRLGYSAVSRIVREADSQNRLFVDVVEELGLISREGILAALMEAAKGGQGPEAVGQARPRHPKR